MKKKKQLQYKVHVVGAMYIFFSKIPNINTHNTRLFNCRNNVILGNRYVNPYVDFQSY